MMSILRPWLLAAASSIVIAGALSRSRANADLRASTTTTLGRPHESAVTWRPGAWRIGASTSNGRPRFHLLGPRWSLIESWGVGQLAVRWGRGASGFPAAPLPLAWLSGTAGGGLEGAGFVARAGPGRLLIAGGRRQEEPLAIVAFVHRGSGFLVAGRPRLGPRRLEDPRLSLALDLRAPGRRGELELAVVPGGSSALAGRVAAEMPGLAGRIDVRLPVAGPPVGEFAAGPAPQVDLELRGSPGGIRTIIGGRATLPASPLASTRNSAASRSFLETGMPLRLAGGAAEVVLRGELRRAAGGADRSRIHAEVRTPLGRAGADWTRGGGLLVRLRALWDLPAGLALEAGAATWSGPVAETGATADLPLVPGTGLAPLLSRAGEAASLVINWQPARVRVRLGISSRQPRGGRAESRVASRLDLLLPGERRGSPDRTAAASEDGRGGGGRSERPAFEEARHAPFQPHADAGD